MRNVLSDIVAGLGGMKIVLPILLGFLIVAILLIKGCMEESKEDARDSGVIAERLESNEEVLNNVKAAEDAERTRDPDALERVRNEFDRSRRPNGE